MKSLNDGTVLYLVGPGDASRSTAGATVVLARRYLSDAELRQHRALLDRIARARVNPGPGQESYGEAHRARILWIDGLSIGEADGLCEELGRRGEN